MKLNASCNSLRAKGCPASPVSPTRQEAPSRHPVPSGHLGMQGEPEAPNCGAGPPPSQEPPRGPRPSVAAPMKGPSPLCTGTSLQQPSPCPSRSSGASSSKGLMPEGQGHLAPVCPSPHLDGAQSTPPASPPRCPSLKSQPSTSVREIRAHSQIAHQGTSQRPVPAFPDLTGVMGDIIQPLRAVCSGWRDACPTPTMGRAPVGAGLSPSDGLWWEQAAPPQLAFSSS